MTFPFDTNGNVRVNVVQSVGQESVIPQRRELMPLTTADAKGNEVNITGARYVLLNVDTCVRSRFTPEVSRDGVNWHNKSVTNIETGTVSESVVMVGDYLLDVSTYKYVRFPVAVQTAGSASAGLFELKEKPEISTYEKALRKNRRPVQMIPEADMIQTGQAYFTAGRNTDEYYAVTGGLVRKTVNGGATFTTLYTFTGQTVRRVRLLNDGNLLVTLQDGSYWKSVDGDENNYKKVFQVLTDTANTSYGISIYRNIVFTSEYGLNQPPNNAKRAYISKDHGESWEEVFTGPGDKGTFHPHGIAIDPYDGVLWMVTGDGVLNSNVYWSPDWGETWNQVYADGESPSQLLNIIVLPNCVLFTTDSKNTGVWRWDRPVGGIHSLSKIVFEQAFVIDKQYQGAEPMGTEIAVTYGDDATGYFGFSFFADGVHRHGEVYATQDGYNFYRIWISPTMPKTITGQGAIGVMSISDPSVDGILPVTYRSIEETGSSYFFVKIKTPDWK